MIGAWESRSRPRRPWTSVLALLSFAVVVVVGVVYLMGRRHGRKKRTIVEIKRV